MLCARPSGWRGFPQNVKYVVRFGAGACLECPERQQETSRSVKSGRQPAGWLGVWFLYVAVTCLSDSTAGTKEAADEGLIKVLFSANSEVYLKIMA